MVTRVLLEGLAWAANAPRHAHAVRRGGGSLANAGRPQSAQLHRGGELGAAGGVAGDSAGEESPLTTGRVATVFGCGVLSLVSRVVSCWGSDGGSSRRCRASTIWHTRHQRREKVSKEINHTLNISLLI